MKAPIGPNALSYAQSDTLRRVTSTLTTVAAGTKAGAATRARDSGCLTRHRLLSGPLRRELRSMQAPIGPIALSYSQSDTLRRATSTLTTVAAA